MLTSSLLGELPTSVLLSLAREEESVLTSSYSQSIRIIMSKLFNLDRRDLIIRITSFFLGLPTSLRSNRYNYVPEINMLIKLP